jgi:hypothetical protein
MSFWLRTFPHVHDRGGNEPSVMDGFPNHTGSHWLLVIQQHVSAMRLLMSVTYIEKNFFHPLRSY